MGGASGGCNLPQSRPDLEEVTMAFGEATPNSNDIFSPDDIIYGYSRADAIRDGLLVDVSETAKEAGFVFPVAVTSAVWHDAIEPPKGTEGNQDVKGRLWDMLVILSVEIRRQRGTGDMVYFSPLFVKAAGEKATPIRLRAVCGPGDDAEPVITIFMGNELD